MTEQTDTVFDPSLDPNSKTYSLGLRLDRTWHAPGVRLMWTCHGQYFYGKAEALIASGVAEADWFPADWKQRKLTVDGRSITVRRKSKYCFDVWVYYLPEEEAQEVENYAVCELVALSRWHGADFNRRDLLMMTPLQARRAVLGLAL